VSRCIVSTCFPCTARKGERYVQRRVHGSISGIPKLDQIVLAARHKEIHHWVPFDAFDVPTWLVKIRSSRLAAKDHMRMVESSLAVTNCASLSEKLTCIASRCVGHAVRLFTLGWKYLTDAM